MSYVTAVPEALDSAATDLARLGSTISAANTAAAVQTTGVGAAAEDEVSTAIAALFGTHGQEFQALSAQAGVFHDQFVQALIGGAQSYGATEAANASPLFERVFNEFSQSPFQGFDANLFNAELFITDAPPTIVTEYVGKAIINEINHIEYIAETDAGQPRFPTSLFDL
jgi:hypothetical protein